MPIKKKPTAKALPKKTDAKKPAKKKAWVAAPSGKAPLLAPPEAIPARVVDPEEYRKLEAERKAADMLSPLIGISLERRLVILSQRFDLFAAATLKVRTKDGGPLFPFVLNSIQSDFLRQIRERYGRNGMIDRFRGIRALIVKARQFGFSTLIAGIFLADGFLEPGRTTVVLTHVLTMSQELLRTYKIFFDTLPEKLKSAVKIVSDSKYALEVEFRSGGPDDPPSIFVIATEGGADWRGGTIHNLHASESAHYKDWHKFKASFVQAVPAEGNIFYETTVNGFNDFYQAAKACIDGESDDMLFFYPWFFHPEYRKLWDPEKEKPIQRRAEMQSGHEDESEEAVMERFGLSLDQMAWRRWKMREAGYLFFQECPETLLGAFLSSGNPIFDLRIVQEYHERTAKEFKAHPPRTPRAGVMVWQNPEPGEIYLLSADVAEGITTRKSTSADEEQGGSDFCSAYLTKVSTMEDVAAIHGRMTPVEFARIIDKLGRLYSAAVAVERNNHGHTVLATLAASDYPWIYRHREYNDSGQVFYKPGFPTTTTTRPLIIDALDEVIRRHGCPCPDPRFWGECHSFQRNDTGKAEAIKGHHDDRVIAKGIGVYLCTLGRSAWGLEGVQDADGAGFPRAKGQRAPKDPEPNVWDDPRHVRRLDGRPVAEDVISGLMDGLKLAKSLTCETCESFDNGFCKVNRFTTKATDPGCPDYFPIPEDEDDLDTMPAGDLSGGEDWNL